jgi:hypothetical protein
VTRIAVSASRPRIPGIRPASQAPPSCYNIYIVASAVRLADALKLPEGPQRTAAVAAWIQSLYETRPPVLVGGAAVELYTAGAYTTGDFDFIGEVTDEVSTALKESGFQREGRHWIHPKAELFVEFPGSAVQAHERTAILQVGGISVLTLSPEDMIIDRLAAWQSLNSTTDGANAFLIWRAQEGRLNKSRLSTLANARGVERALLRLLRFGRRVGPRPPSAKDLEAWASEAP